MKSKFGLLYILFSVLCVILTGCGQTFDTHMEDAVEANPLDSNLTVVGVSQVGSESVWRTANTASVQDAFTRENGYFLIFDNARQKQENQIKAIRSFISQRVDYIVFSPIKETGWETVLTEAKEAGIPVILMDRMVDVTDETLFAAWVGSDFEKEGQLAGNWLEEALSQKDSSEEVRIVVLQGTQGATSMLGRTKGFAEVAKKHSNWKIIEQIDAEYTTAKGREEMRRILNTYDHIDVLVSQNDDMTFGAIEAMKEAGLKPGSENDIMVISFDATKAGLNLVQTGEIDVDIECNPLQGDYVSKIIQMIQNNESYDKKCFVPEMVFTKENVDDLIDQRTY